MTNPYLDDSLAKEILDYLSCLRKAPTLRYANQLIHAYIRKAPWESVSRIVKRHTTKNTSACPRWPVEFWQNALQNGFGGTCFESSLAFYSLLISLGYDSYLTVNNMGPSIGCHAAIVLTINHKKYLVDVTIPLHCAVRLDPNSIVRQRTAFHNYTIRPDGANVYQVERSHHPHRNIFTLIDAPVNLRDYQYFVENDYTDQGHFLRSVVMAKVIDGMVWRFNSDEKPYRMEAFNREGKSEFVLPEETMARSLAERFQLPEDKISAALLWIQS